MAPHPERVPSSEYYEFAAPLALRHRLVCLWTQSVGDGETTYQQPVLPDGCVDIILMNEGSPAVVGPSTRHFIAHLAPGTTIVGARLLPGHAPSLLGVPASELIDQSVPLRDVSGSRRSAAFCSIVEERTASAKLSALEFALAGQLDRAPADPVITAAVRWLAAEPNGRVEELSRLLGISSRQLQRRFSAAVGYGPKMFQRVIRFQRLLHVAARAAHPQALAQLSSETGYADQAHMTRDVQRLSGKSPGVLLQSAESAIEKAALFRDW